MKCRPGTVTSRWFGQARQISRWSGQYRASETQAVPAMDKLIEWLPANIPDDDSASIVHGDFRLDNMIVHPTEPRVIAVLDWELSTIGHPLADFTYHLMAWQMPEIGIGSTGLAGKDLKFDVIVLAVRDATEEELTHGHVHGPGGHDHG